MYTLINCIRFSTMYKTRRRSYKSAYLRQAKCTQRQTDTHTHTHTHTRTKAIS